MYKVGKSCIFIGWFFLGIFMWLKCFYYYEIKELFRFGIYCVINELFSIVVLKFY